VVPTDNEEALKLFWNNLEMKLKSKGEKMTSAKKIWEFLKDGKPHSLESVVAVTHYKQSHSTGFEEIIRAMKALGYVASENGSYQFTDKVFPLGRP
jgi:beta-lactamase superfamily II metal-dependent hydrolase